MRALDQRKIPYEIYSYTPEIKSAEGVAQVLGVPASQVYKTLVMLRDDNPRPILVMVPGDREVDMRVLARGVGSKGVRMAPKPRAEALTGLQTGGIGALALLNKPFDVYIDTQVLSAEAIFVNGGRRGLNIRLAAADLIAVTGASAVGTRE
jgi:Cys-tRNA(Pro)/Cys-tRNA(Cys) deacylase